MAYRETKKLIPEQAAYIAGLIDGEGTISLSRKHRYENRQLVVSISSTEINLLKYVREAIGAGKITNKRSYSPRHLPSMCYAISNRQALGLLREVSPYLKSYKVARAGLILKHYLRLTPRNGRYTAEQRKERESFIKHFFSLRVSSRSHLFKPLDGC